MHNVYLRYRSWGAYKPRYATFCFPTAEGLQKMAAEDGDTQDKARNIELIFKPGPIPGKDRRPGVRKRRTADSYWQ